MIDIAGIHHGWVVECYEQKWIVIAQHGSTYLVVPYTSDLPAQVYVLHESACRSLRLPTPDERATAERLRMTLTPRRV